MSRDDGFPAADLDVKFLRDPKIRRLRRFLPRRGDAAAAEHLYLAVVLSSWETGYRVTLDDAIAYEDATPERVTALKRELLDAEGKVPLDVWERWFRPAWDRREKKRAGGREGNRRRWHADRSPTDGRSLSDSDTDSDPESPSVPPSLPSGPSAPSGPSKFPPSAGPCRKCGRDMTDAYPGAVVGPGWIEHGACGLAVAS